MDQNNISNAADDIIQSEKPYTFAEVFPLLNFTALCSILVNLIKNDSPIRAVKTLRSEAQLNLREAKDAINDLIDLLGFTTDSDQLLYAREEATRLNRRIANAEERERKAYEEIRRQRDAAEDYHDAARALEKDLERANAEASKWEERAHAARDAGRELQQQVQLLEQVLHGRIHAPPKIESSKELEEKEQNPLADLLQMMSGGGNCDEC